MRSSLSRFLLVVLPALVLAVFCGPAHTAHAQDEDSVAIDDSSSISEASAASRGADGDGSSDKAAAEKESASAEGDDEEEEEEGDASSPAPAPRAANLLKATEVDIPRARAFYPENEPQLQQKQLVERMLGLYEVHPPWRHAAERVESSGSEVIVSYWYSVGADPEAVSCDALRWLSTGRNQWAGGAAAVFEEQGHVDRLTLVFVNVEKRQRGKVPGQEGVHRYLSASVARNRVGEIAPANASEVLASAKCLDFMKKAMSAFTFDTVYYQKEQQRGLDPH